MTKNKKIRFCSTNTILLWTQCKKKLDQKNLCWKFARCIYPYPLHYKAPSIPFDNYNMEPQEQHRIIELTDVETTIYPKGILAQQRQRNSNNLTTALM